MFQTIFHSAGSIRHRRHTCAGHHNLRNAVTALFLALVIAVGPVCPELKAADYSSYSNLSCGFGLGLKTDHTRPDPSMASSVKKLTDYNAYYCDSKSAKKKKKVIYLTFDCGYENGYTKRILKTLKKNKIKAIFFVTEPYIKDNPKIVKQMKKEGHLVGNHTCNHPRLTSLSEAGFKRELSQCAKTMKKLTGYKMDPYLRPPEGVYSQKTLKMAQDLGYSTIFWSLAYHDWDPANQPGADAVLSKFKTYYHPGMMPLIHVVSKSNTEALPDIIKFMKKKGYKFGTLEDFVKIPEKKKGGSNFKGSATKN